MSAVGFVILLSDFNCDLGKSLWDESKKVIVGCYYLTLATITRCDLSATILLKLVDSYFIAFKFAQ